MSLYDYGLFGYKGSRVMKRHIDGSDFNPWARHKHTYSNGKQKRIFKN